MSDNSPASSQIASETRNAARTSVAFFDLSDRTQIEMTGADRTRFLHSFTSNDIKRLKPGQGCETFLTNLKGKVVAHVYAFCSENSLWLDGTPGQETTITTSLQKFVLIDDVQLKPAGPARGELFVSGPLAAQLLQVETLLTVGDHVLRGTNNRSLDIRRVDLLGLPGFLISVPKDQIDGVKQGLSAIGVAEGSRELFEALRIEAGYPQYGIDITDDNLAQEVARTRQCISFNKGCYLGQETIARLDALGHTNRELRRLRFETSVAPAPGTVIFEKDGSVEVGKVTSAAIDLEQEADLPTRTVVALGLLKRSACQSGTEVCLTMDGDRIPGSVLDPI